MHNIRPTSILLAALALLPACALNVGELKPTPNVLLVHSSQRLALRIGPEVNEAFSIEPTTTATIIGAPQSVDVSQWRETLTNAFRSSIGNAFAPAPNQADLTLVLIDATPAVVVQNHALTAQVRFRAELLDAKQQVVKTWADTASSRNPGFIDDAVPPMRSAVEAMYEEIANGMPPVTPATGS